MNALRLLYLEDNPDHVELVAGALQPQYPGTQVESAAAIPDALVCMQKRRYDVILVSALIHGEATLPHLHKIVLQSKTAPVIVISGDGDEKGAANAIKHGASDYLVKSRESLEVLPYLIQRLLKKRKPGPIAPEPSDLPHAEVETVSHLMTEIEHVSQRIHNLQETPNTDAAIASLREDLRLLRQFAENLDNSGKTRKSGR